MIGKFLQVKLLFKVLFEQLQNSTYNVLLFWFVNLALWFHEESDQEKVEKAFAHRFCAVKGEYYFHGNTLDVVDVGKWWDYWFVGRETCQVAEE